MGLEESCLHRDVLSAELRMNEPKLVATSYNYLNCDLSVLSCNMGLAVFRLSQGLDP
jgi:hypothetical protein